MIEPKPSLRKLVRISEKEPSRLFKRRMDRNERTHPYSKSFVKRLRSRLTGELIMTYPEPEPLYERFSKWLGVRRGQLLFHTGSDLAIKAVFETYISPGDKILLHSPGYAMYKVYSNMFGARPVFLDYDSELNFDFDRYISMLDGSFRMAVIENPNGFIGNAHPISKIEAFIRKARRLGVLVLADEAYFHFIKDTAARFMDKYDNFIVVRTFSKAFGLAGLRAAYLLSQEKNIANLCRVKPMHELTSASILAVDLMLDTEKEFRKFIAETGKSREFLAKGLGRLGIRTSDSRANFLAVKFGPDVDGVGLAERLRRYGFLIRRPFREEHLKDWSRVGTLPVPEERRMLGLLEKYVGKAGLRRAGRTNA